ncbi:hypothetical protein BC829DRAFT_212447 [Chytridium lagenaria]|nr:hypothetical protein BC829DRAFT_212447 [Chytridium lagenaria]
MSLSPDPQWHHAKMDMVVLQTMVTHLPRFTSTGHLSFTKLVPSQTRLTTLWRCPHATTRSTPSIPLPPSPLFHLIKPRPHGLPQFPATTQSHLPTPTIPSNSRPSATSRPPRPITPPPPLQQQPPSNTSLPSPSSTVKPITTATSTFPQDQVTAIAVAAATAAAAALVGRLPTPITNGGKLPISPAPPNLASVVATAAAAAAAAAVTNTTNTPPTLPLKKKPEEPKKNPAQTEAGNSEKRFQCHFCQKRFSRPSSLTTHVYTHTGERPHACTMPGCGRSFSVLQTSVVTFVSVNATFLVEESQEPLHHLPPSLKTIPPNQISLNPCQRINVNSTLLYPNPPSVPQLLPPPPPSLLALTPIVKTRRPHLHVNVARGPRRRLHRRLSCMMTRRTMRRL